MSVSGNGRVYVVSEVAALRQFLCFLPVLGRWQGSLHAVQTRPARPQNWQIETPPPSLNFARCAALRDLAGDYRLCQ